MRYCLSLTIMLLCSITAQARQHQNFDAGWLFVLADSVQMSRPEYNDRHWRRLDLPHEWAVEGDFMEGDIVDIKDQQGYLFARGRVAFSRDEAELALGRTREELSRNRLLAEMADKPLVHRDELVIFE